VHHLDKRDILDRGRGRVVLVVSVTLESDVGRAGVGRGGDKVLGFVRDGVTGGDETGEGTELEPDCFEGVADGVAGGGFVILAGKKVVAVNVKRVVTVTTELIGELVGEDKESVGVGAG
jgi:hypothetical protein